MRYEESFGIVPLRKVEGEWQVFLIEMKSHHWGFPKGHAEEGETPFISAQRELKEETNLDIVSKIYSDPILEQYQFRVSGEKIQKQVTYFLAEVSGDIVLQSAEIKNGLWLDFSQAMSRLTYLEGKRVLTQVVKIVMSL